MELYKGIPECRRLSDSGDNLTEKLSTPKILDGWMLYVAEERGGVIVDEVQR